MITLDGRSLTRDELVAIAHGDAIEVSAPASGADLSQVSWGRPLSDPVGLSAAERARDVGVIELPCAAPATELRQPLESPA